MNPLSQALYFLVGTLFDLYILVMMLRFVLQLLRADFYNPLSQFIVKATNPLVIPLRRFIPGFGGMDLASLLLVIALIVLELFLLTVIAGRLVIGEGLAMFTFVSLLNRLWWLFMACIFIQVIVSWVNPMGYNPAMAPIYSITGPLLRPVQRMLPPMGGFDLSPMVVAIGFGLLKIILIAPLIAVATGLNRGFNPLY